MIQKITPGGQFHKKQIKENWQVIGIEGVHITKLNFAWSIETITTQEECTLIFGIPYVIFNLKYHFIILLFYHPTIPFKLFFSLIGLSGLSLTGLSDETTKKFYFIKSRKLKKTLRF